MISSADPADLINRAFVEAAASVRSGGPVGPTADSGELAAYRIAIGGAVGAGNSAFALISAHDTAWHTAVFSGEIGHDPVDERAILDRYRAWLAASDGLIAASEAFEPIGGPVDGMEELRTCRREARGLLTPDDLFFEGEALDRLAATAILADERGETAPLEEMPG